MYTQIALYFCCPWSWFPYMKGNSSLGYKLKNIIKVEKKDSTFTNILIGPNHRCCIIESVDDYPKSIGIQQGSNMKEFLSADKGPSKLIENGIFTKEEWETFYNNLKTIINEYSQLNEQLSTESDEQLTLLSSRRKTQQQERMLQKDQYQDKQFYMANQQGQQEYKEQPYISRKQFNEGFDNGLLAISSNKPLPLQQRTETKYSFEAQQPQTLPTSSKNKGQNISNFNDEYESQKKYGKGQQQKGNQNLQNQQVLSEGEINQPEKLKFSLVQARQGKQKQQKQQQNMQILQDQTEKNNSRPKIHQPGKY